MKLYLRCFIANRFSLLGGICLLAALVPAVGTYRLHFFLAGFLLQVITVFGYQTYKIYLSTYRVLKQHGYVRQKYVNVYQREYCCRVGYRLAVCDFGKGV